MNRNPQLRCEGTCRTVTPHTFAEEITISRMNGELVGYEQVYACDGCKKRRRWGYTAQGMMRVEIDWKERQASA
jgi:hypothetical protein